MKTLRKQRVIGLGLCPTTNIVNCFNYYRRIGMSNVIEYDVYESFNKSGSCRQGEITTTYDTLNNLFGTPSYTDADPYEKVSCEWVLNVQVEDGDDITRLVLRTGLHLCMEVW